MADRRRYIPQEDFPPNISVRLVDGVGDIVGVQVVLDTQVSDTKTAETEDPQEKTPIDTHLAGIDSMKYEAQVALPRKLEALAIERSKAFFEAFFKSPIEKEYLQSEPDLQPGKQYLNTYFGGRMVLAVEDLLGLDKPDFIRDFGKKLALLINPDALLVNGKMLDVYDARARVDSVMEIYATQLLLPAYIKQVQDNERLTEEIKLRDLFSRVKRGQKQSQLDGALAPYEQDIKDKEDSFARAITTVQARLARLAEEAERQTYAETDETKNFMEVMTNLLKIPGSDLSIEKFVDGTSLLRVYGLSHATGVEHPSVAEDSINRIIRAFKRKVKNVKDLEENRHFGIIVSGTNDKAIKGGFFIEMTIDALEGKLYHSGDRLGRRVATVHVRKLTQEATTAAQEEITDEFAVRGQKPYVDIGNLGPQIVRYVMDNRALPMISARAREVIGAHEKSIVFIPPMDIFQLEKTAKGQASGDTDQDQ